MTLDYIRRAVARPAAKLRLVPPGAGVGWATDKGSRAATVPKGAFIVLAATVALCGCQSAATTRSAAPAPATAEVSHPARSVSSPLAVYSGTWHGAWDNILPTKLVVQTVTPPTASVVYSWGTAPKWDVSHPGSETLTGHFKGDEMVIDLPGKALLTYRHTSAGKLDAVYENPRTGRRLTAVLTKQ